MNTPFINSKGNNAEHLVLFKIVLAVGLHHLAMFMPHRSGIWLSFGTCGKWDWGKRLSKNECLGKECKLTWGPRQKKKKKWRTNMFQGGGVNKANCYTKRKT